MEDINSGIWSLIVGSEAISWASLLLREHLEPAARLTLFRTCKASRDMVLSTAGHLAATLALAMGDPARDFKRVRALRSLLKTRGTQTTRLLFKLQGRDLWPLTQALGVLELDGQWLKEMEVEYSAGTLPVSIVAEIGCSYPNLKYLAIENKLEAMPDPELFPRLQELHICPAGMEAANLERLYRTMQPYLSRLARLAVTQPNVLAPLPRLPLLLGSGPLPGLRSLELATTLDDDLLGLLLQWVPTLGTLTVSHVQLHSDMHAHTTCAWQCLVCNGAMYLSSFARLPLPEGAAVRARTVVCNTITDEDQAALQAAMTRIVIRTGKQSIAGQSGHHGVCLEPVAELQTDLQPAALRVGLELLRTCLDEGDYPPSKLCLSLQGWTLSARLIRELQGLPRWASLMLGGTWVTGHCHMYTTVLRFLPTSFSTVILHVNAPSVEAICWGAPVERPFHIKLYGDASRVQSLVAALKLSEALPHVIISHF